MNELTDFLRSRLDEDERIALAAEAEGKSPWVIAEDSPGDVGDDVWLDTSTRRPSTVGDYAVTIGMTCGCCGRGAIAVPFARHIAHFDAGRMLRDVEAGRRVLGRHQRLPDPRAGYSLPDICGLCDIEWPCPELIDLAYPYVGHPDYLDEWRPA